MSIENAKLFQVRINRDRAFRALLERAESREESSKLIEDAGYYFTIEEWQQAMKVFQTPDNGELREKELEAIAGGAGVINGIGNGSNNLYDLIREEIVKANGIRFGS